MKLLMKNVIITLVFIFVGVTGCAQDSQTTSQVSKSSFPKEDRVEKSDADWKKLLSPEEFYVLRQQGTEYAFSGKYFDHKEKGVYTCAACGNELFSSKSKYRSGTGWPSFWEPIAELNVDTRPEPTYGFGTLEVHCARCDGHLGHIFKDGPKPTGLRYCINSISLDFKPVK
jgi:peptide-methionine (R)-S-oxide reductase